MTNMTTVEIEEYVAAVRAALADLSDDAKADLLDDLPDHLAEVLSEGEGSLRDRLGDPSAYAAELRAAAGFEPVDEAALSKSARLHRVVERGAALAGRADRRIGAALGFSRFGELLHALRPGWWVLRGWVVAQLLGGVHDRESWSGWIPDIGGGLLGLALVLVSIGVSVYIGRRSQSWHRWPARTMTLLNAAIALFGLTLAGNVGRTVHTYYDQAGYNDPIRGAQNLYLYDRNGNPLRDVRVYDEYGNQIQVGDPYCGRGPQPGTYNPDTGEFTFATPEYAYPLCAEDRGPFGNRGPGPLRTAPSASSSPSVAPSGPGATATPPKPSAKPTPKPTAKVTPSTSR